MKKSSKSFEFLVSVSMFLGTMILFVVIVGLKIGECPFFLLDSLPRMYPFPHANICRLPIIGGLSLNTYWAYLIVLLALILFVFRLLFKKSCFSSCFSRSRILKAVVLCVFILSILIQSVNHFLIFRGEINRFSGKALVSINKKAHAFTQHAHQLLPGKHGARFITDLDINSDPGMCIHRVYSYYLYPFFDVKNVHGKEKDVIVMFEKKDALKHVPKGYVALPPFDASNLIAVRKELLQK